MNEMKYALENIGTRAEEMEEKSNELKTRNLEMTHEKKR